MQTCQPLRYSTRINLSPKQLLDKLVQFNIRPIRLFYLRNHFLIHHVLALLLCLIFFKIRIPGYKRKEIGQALL